MPPTALALNATQADELTAASCQLSDGSKVSQYRLVVPVRGTLQLTAKASGFTPSFLIRDAAGRKVESGSTISRYIEAGSYVVLLNGSGFGKFTLTSAFQPETDVLCTWFNRLGAGRTAAGRLGPASCKLPDGTAFDQWQTTIYGAGTLTIDMQASSFDFYLILRAEDGTLLATADSSGGAGGSQISLPVSGNQTYSILAAASSNASNGPYQLSVGFTPNPDETCVPVRTITQSTQVNGSVSAASCNFNLPQRQDSSLFNVYTVHLEQPGTVQISVPASTFTPLLLLLDADGNPLVEDSESGGLHSPLIMQPLARGDYSLVVFNEDSFEGDYTLQYNYNPAAAKPCSVQAISSGQTATGILTGEAGCRMTELLSALYRFTLTSSSTVEIGLASADFTAFLELRDAKDNLLNYGDQTPDGASAHLKVDLPAGTYVVAAATVDLPGTYSLNAQFTPKAILPCTVTSLPVNSGFVGNLGQGDCTGPGGEPLDIYRFTTPANGTAAFVMTSGDIDSLLTLSDSTGKILRFDSGSYAHNDALIVHYLKAGTYLLKARSLNGIGRYRVDALWTAGPKPAFCSPSPVQLGSATSATLTYTACQYYDQTFADWYRFTVTDPDQPVNLLGNSNDFDLSLVLMDSKGNLLATGDSPGRGSDAQLNSALIPGTYFVIVKPVLDASQSGKYTLSVLQ